MAVADEYTLTDECGAPGLLAYGIQVNLLPGVTGSSAYALALAMVEIRQRHPGKKFFPPVPHTLQPFEIERRGVQVTLYHAYHYMIFED